MVISRRMSTCQSREASRTSVTAPSVRQARKLMMAMTMVSALPETVPSGTIWLGRAARAAPDGDKPRPEAYGRVQRQS